MSNTKDRAAARRAEGPPLVPDHIRATYAEALARIPRVDLDRRRPVGGGRLPAVGSFCT